MAEAVDAEEVAQAKEEVGVEAQAADLSRTTFGRAPILRPRARTPNGTSRLHKHTKRLEQTTEQKATAKARKEKAREKMAASRRETLERAQARVSVIFGRMGNTAREPTAPSLTLSDTLPRLP